MSLDIYLKSEPQEVVCECESCGNQHKAVKTETFYSSNITHNLGSMAAEAGIYEIVWRPEEVGITKAVQLIKPLREAIELMKADPPRFEKHNASNGWGLYEHFLPWLERYLKACEEYPESIPCASR